MSDKAKKPERVLKTKIDLAEPSDVLDVAKLFMASQLDRPWIYPSLKREDLSSITQFVYHLLAGPCVSLIVRRGKKAVGFVLANPANRPIGVPRTFLRVTAAFADPTVRQSELPSQMKKALGMVAGRAGLSHWEVNPSDMAAIELMGGVHGMFPQDAEG
jgi:hypothetical protein